VFIGLWRLSDFGQTLLADLTVNVAVQIATVSLILRGP